jgi:hypothetical protein
VRNRGGTRRPGQHDIAGHTFETVRRVRVIGF